ncbi:putative integral inner membrane protein [Bacillus tequilensis]|nr:putative integral inner membrane protein [Bacillus tequilensis]
MNVADMFSSYLSRLPNVIIALLVLLIGWLSLKSLKKRCTKGSKKQNLTITFCWEKAITLFLGKSHKQGCLFYRIDYRLYFIL